LVNALHAGVHSAYAIAIAITVAIAMPSHVARVWLPGKGDFLWLQWFAGIMSYLNLTLAAWLSRQINGSG
jgi:hypothetical protein